MTQENTSVFQCPNCHSENIQKYEVAYQNGVSNVNLTTTGGGIGGDGLFGGAAQSTGTQQSALSISTAPPQKLSVIKTFLLVSVLGAGIAGIILSLVFSETIGNFGTAALFFLGIYRAYQASEYNKNQWPKLMEQWRHSYVCLRCGHRFLL